MDKVQQEKALTELENQNQKILIMSISDNVSEAMAICDLMLDAEYRGMFEDHYRQLPALLRAIFERLNDANESLGKVIMHV